MDTIVYDPFFTDMPRFFGMSFQQLMREKDPKAWVEFERGEIDEEELFRCLFTDRRQIDGAALREHMVRAWW